MNVMEYVTYKTKLKLDKEVAGGVSRQTRMGDGFTLDPRGVFQGNVKFAAPNIFKDFAADPMPPTRTDRIIY